jgi:signal peptidase I
MPTLRRIAGGAATLLSGVAVLAVCLLAAAMVSGLRPEPVLSGSMAPKMPVGSLAVVKAVPAASVRVGDVITFVDPLDSSKRVTHRIIKITQHGSSRVYTTRGDANNTADPWQLQLPGQVGRRVAVVPHAGYILNYAGRPQLRGVLIGLAALLLLGGALRAIWRREPSAPGASIG